MHEKLECMSSAEQRLAFTAAVESPREIGVDDRLPSCTSESHHHTCKQRARVCVCVPLLEIFSAGLGNWPPVADQPPRNANLTAIVDQEINRAIAAHRLRHEILHLSCQSSTRVKRHLGLVTDVADDVVHLRTTGCSDLLCRDRKLLLASSSKNDCAS